jgi:tRNA(Arg) A34 adenosine deaminase TadA
MLMEWDDLRFLRRAIAIAQRARDHGNHPFGALLVDADQQVLLEAENKEQYADR